MKQKWQNRKSGVNSDARVCLWKDGAEKTHLVARLVAMSFLPAPYDKLTVNHIDGNPENNSVDNLEWVTLSENIRLGFKTGLYNATKKKTILVNEQGETICFQSQAEASRFLGRCHGYINDAVRHGYFATAQDGTRYIVKAVEDGSS